MNRNNVRTYAVIGALAIAVFGLQLAFSSELTHGDFWRARGPDGNEPVLGPPIPDGFETTFLEPALSLSRYLLSASNTGPRGVLQPVQALFRHADTYGASSLAVLVASLNTLFWAAIGVLSFGIASAVRLGRQTGAPVVGRRALNVGPLLLALVLLPLFAACFSTRGIPTPLPRALFGFAFFLLLWVWLVWPLRWLAARIQRQAAPPLPPLSVGILSFFVLQYLLLGPRLSGAAYISIKPPLSRAAAHIAPILLQPSEAFIRWVSHLPPTSRAWRLLDGLWSTVGRHTFLFLVAFAQTVLWLTVAFVALALYRRHRRTALGHTVPGA